MNVNYDVYVPAFGCLQFGSAKLLYGEIKEDKARAVVARLQRGPQEFEVIQWRDGYSVDAFIWSPQTRRFEKP